MADKHEQAYVDYMKGMKYKDIANKYSVTLSTVKSWKQRYEWDRKSTRTSEKKVCDAKSEKYAEENTVNEDSISWVDMEHEYVTDIRKKPCTAEEIAKKYSVGIGTVQKYSMEHEWSEKRKNYKKTIQTKAIEKSSDEDADRIVNLLRIADMASEKAEQAIGELETYLVHNKTKTKVVEYKDHTAIGKPTKEVIQEDETIEKMSGPVDRLGLSQVTAALKNIKEIYSLPVDLEDKKYKTEFDKKRAEVSDNSGEEILKNMQAIADILQNPVSNRKIEDYE